MNDTLRKLIEQFNDLTYTLANDPMSSNEKSGFQTELERVYNELYFTSEGRKWLELELIFGCPNYDFGS